MNSFLPALAIFWAVLTVYTVYTVHAHKVYKSGASAAEQKKYRADNKCMAHTNSRQRIRLSRSVASLVHGTP